MFAKRTGASCSLCHTVFPGMTNYGMMVMMSDFTPLPYHAAQDPGIASFVVSEAYLSAPDGNPPPPKLFTENIGILDGGYFGPNFTYYLEQHIVDTGFIGGTDQLWVSYNQLFHGAGNLQVGKFHTPFPFMPAHRITVSPYATTSATIGNNNFNEDDSHWGATLNDMIGPVMLSYSALGGNQLIGEPGWAQLRGLPNNHSLDLTAMSMTDNPFNAGAGYIQGYAPPATDGAPADRFNRTALYLQYLPPGIPQLQFQALGQLLADSDPYGTGVATHTRGFFTEAQYDFTHGNWGILRWDDQNGDAPVAGLTADFIHQFAPNFKLTVEGRTLTTGTQFGMTLEWAGPWSKHNILAQPVLGSMPGMAGMNMNSMAMAPGAPLSPLETTLSQGDATRGQSLFSNYNCASCHGAGGSGGGIGPKLVGLSDAMQPDLIYDHIKSPRPPMPDFKLSDGQIADLVAYIVALTPGHTVAADIAKTHASSTSHAMTMHGMNMSGMGMGPMSMAQPPPIYPEDQAPLKAGTHGYFPGVQDGSPRAGNALFANSCAACHGAAAQGGNAPSLAALPSSFTPSAIAWQIQGHGPTTPPLRLTDRDIADLTAFLETR